MKVLDLQLFTFQQDFNSTQEALVVDDSIRIEIFTTFVFNDIFNIYLIFSLFPNEIAKYANKQKKDFVTTHTHTR